VNVRNTLPLVNKKEDFLPHCSGANFALLRKLQGNLELTPITGFNNVMSKTSKGSLKKPVGASDFVTEAYNARDEKSLKEFYAKWADDYDAQMID
jgi:hypothetical protein